MGFKKDVELKDTVELMLSDDYKKRFKAEYFQLENRLYKLKGMIDKYKAGTLGFEPTCPIELLEEQLEHMSGYIYALEARSFEEGINLFALNHSEKEVMSDLS